jgi:hypothetical protein
MTTDPRDLACICVPSLDAGCFETEQLLSQLARDGWTVIRLHGVSHVGRARSSLAARALGSVGHPWLMWIDSDMAFDPDDVGRLVLAADTSGAELVGGVYVGKEVAGGKLCVSFADPAGVTLGLGGGLVPITQIGFGFVATSRRAFELVGAAMPACSFGLGPDGRLIEGRPWFSDLCEDGHYWGEDYSFCARLARAGGKLLADTRPRLWHLGEYRYSWEDATCALERATAIRIGTPDAPAALPRAERRRLQANHRRRRKG